MTLKVVISSLFSSLSNAFASKHTWRNDDCIGLRTCSVCGRKEELTVDLMNTSWEVVELGDAGAHPVKTRRKQAAQSGSPGLALAREEPTPLQRRA